jgi:D-arabinose 1-dehydrogenase-like Zn-dependent alcohol dehydrogenase
VKSEENWHLGLGAEHFIDFKESDPIKEVLEITNGGAHVVLVTGEHKDTLGESPLTDDS